MSKSFTFKGRRYRLNVSQAAAALVGIVGISAWIYVIAVLEKAVLLG